MLKLDGKGSRSSASEHVRPLFDKEQRPFYVSLMAVKLFILAGVS